MNVQHAKCPRCKTLSTSFVFINFFELFASPPARKVEAGNILTTKVDHRITKGNPINGDGQFRNDEILLQDVQCQGMGGNQTFISRSGSIFQTEERGGMKTTLENTNLAMSDA